MRNGIFNTSLHLSDLRINNLNLTMIHIVFNLKLIIFICYITLCICINT